MEMPWISFCALCKQRYGRRKYTIEDVPLLKMMEIMSFKDTEFEPIKSDVPDSYLFWIPSKILFM